ncbi:MAG: Single-stranded DNA-binding protein [Candidatus Uhrbacteria bacterium GW2011_GWA2_52_8d]|uniref:Single-stranded DNA-binding protein n=1 Tax=Candidatus Uhrbacteria bacterium GW2011_GWA2_52_8d TaxID=1618979 RepID=A0A0G1XKI1_9BACT|nr:MAG: Single-stranded DNA-binding protein [Candidatus Uhrbacteria bacterium GW2011_GWA2_52_8d]
MYSLNRAMIIGNLTRDPEVKQTPSGQSVCTFSVATNRSWNGQDGKKQEATDFHNVVAWGKLAEICGQYLRKGRKVYIEGRLQTHDWEGQDGVRRYRTEIITENMIILDRPGGSVPVSSGKGFGSPSAFTPPAPPVQDDRAPNPDEEIKIEEIPF